MIHHTSAHIRNRDPGFRYSLRAGRSAKGDAEIAEEVRHGRPHAFQAIVARHWSAVGGYLHTCFTDLPTVDRIAEQTFVHAYQAAARGAAPTTSWRAHLLSTARTLAVREWGRDPQAPGIAEDFREWASGGSTWSLTLGSRLTEAYRCVPERWQTTLWHTVVERDGRAFTTHVLGIPRRTFGVFAGRARSELREAYLELHRRGAVGVECSLCADHLAAAGAAPGIANESEPVDEHLEGCAACRQAYLDLGDLDGQLRLQLPAMLLGWWQGTRYEEARALVRPPAGPLPFLEREMRVAAHAKGTRWFRVGAVACAVALALTVASFQVFDVRDQRTAGQGYESGVRDGGDELLAITPSNSATPTASPTAYRTAPSPSSTVSPPPSPTAPLRDHTATRPQSPSPTRSSAPADQADGRDPLLIPATTKIPAADFTVENSTSPAAGSARAFTNGSWLRFDNVDFGGSARTRVDINFTPHAQARTSIAVRMDLEDAAPAATLAVPGNGAAGLTPTTGVHTVYLTVTCAGTDACVDIAEFTFR